uniref:Uncharacterized protein n=1 Tax=Anopheles atroparvus TaxID=41427 RepID=A0AAG5CSP1_ANOAO
MMNHHTIPKLGFGPYKSSTSGVGSFFLPKILTHPTDRSCAGGKVALELTHGNSKQVITLPSEKLDSNKRYYVTFTLNPNGTSDGDPPPAPPLSPGHTRAAPPQQQQQQQQPHERQPPDPDAQDNAQSAHGRQRQSQHQHPATVLRQQQQQQEQSHAQPQSDGPQSQPRSLPAVEQQWSAAGPKGAAL